MFNVYLIHFASPHHHARHYLGKTTQLARRLWHHRHNSGARLLQVLNEHEIKYKVVRTWDLPDQSECSKLERRFKDRKNSARLCPKCNPKSWEKNGVALKKIQ